MHVSRQVGHLRRALEEAQAAYELAPASPALAFQVGLQRLLNGEHAGVRQWIDTAVANGYPRTLRSVSEARALLALREKRYADAAQELLKTMTPASRAAGGFGAIQLFYAALAEPSNVPAAIAHLQEWLHKLGTHLDRMTAQRSIMWFALLGAVDAAHDLADRTLERWETSGVLGCGWGVLWIAEMNAFRSDVRFRSFVSRLGLDEYWLQYGPPDAYTLRDGALAAAPTLECEH
jgi:hypothetical protein